MGGSVLGQSIRFTLRPVDSRKESRRRLSQGHALITPTSVHVRHEWTRQEPATPRHGPSGRERGPSPRSPRDRDRAAHRMHRRARTIRFQDIDGHARIRIERLDSKCAKRKESVRVGTGGMTRLRWSSSGANARSQHVLRYSRHTRSTTETSTCHSRLSQSVGVHRAHVTDTCLRVIKMMQQVLVALALLVGSAPLATAQEKQDTKRRPLPELLAEFDTNGDGTLDETERKTAREARRKAMQERAGDRENAREGKRGPRGKRRARGRRGLRGARAQRGVRGKRRALPPKLLEKFDTDGDGKLSESERSEIKKRVGSRPRAMPGRRITGRRGGEARRPAGRRQR